MHHLVLAATKDTATHWIDYTNSLKGDFPNEGEMRLYPLIADRLGEVNDATPLAKYLRSSQRWARMQTMVNRRLADEVGRLFITENIPLMWTKGTALVQRIDKRPDLRPSSDIDAIFKWRDVERVIALGNNLNWTPRSGISDNRDYARHANTELSYSIGQLGELDLEWNPRTPFCYDPTLREWMWQDTGLAQDQNGISYASDTWLLIEVIEHGVSANAVYPIRWVVDGIRLLESRHQNIDWQKFIEFAKLYKLHHTFAIGLAVIARYSDHVPQWVLNKLEEMPVSYLDKEEYRSRVTSEDLGVAHRVKYYLNQLRRKPSRQYYKSPPSPLRRGIPVTIRTRFLVAFRNLFTRLLFPLWYFL